MGQKKSTSQMLGVFAVVMITVGSVDSIRNLPATALLGSHLIFYFLLAAVTFFLPCALVSAELASVDKQTGGIYEWVKNAFGVPLGFVAVWFQWSENLIWYPTILAFIAGSLGYLFSPAVAQDRYFILAVVLIAFWFTTLINLRGIVSSARFANVCAIFGLLLPMSLIMALGLYWYLSGHPLQIELTSQAILPSAHSHDMWIVLTAMMMSFAGIEIATVHAKDVVNPARTYPVALFICVIILLVTLMGGSLAIAVSVPVKDLSPILGLMQSFASFFGNFHMMWALPIVAIMLVIGGLGGVNNWVIAPTRGMFISSADGNLPAMLKGKNQYNAPSALLLFQGVLVTAISMAFLLFPSVNTSYWLLTALAAQQYVIMYALMFASAIKQRYKNPDSAYGFKVPGGKVGLWIVCLLGLASCIATFCIGFIPPDNVPVDGVMHYEVLLVAGLVLMSLIPFILRASVKKN